MPLQRARPPDLYDVARLAGVSHQTVSRVINDHPNVRAATRERVKAAIAELGYRRNAAARALVTRRSHTIGVITSASPLWGPIGTLVGIERAARDAGYFINVAGMSETDPTAVDSALRRFVDQGVDGIVVVAPEVALVHIADPVVTDVPVVLIAAGADPAPGVQIAAIDQEGGARLAVRHLLELGHTDVAHISGPEPWFDATARIRGWRRELAAHGLKPGLRRSGDWTAASGFRIGRRLVTRDSLPSAVFVANDLMALGVIKALAEVGVRVPQDISVVGFDDIPGADYFEPGLTTVRQDFDALGRACLEILLATLDGRTVSANLVPSTLIVRESSARPPAQ